MKKILKHCIIFCCLFFISPAFSQVLIINPDNSLSHLSRNQIRSIFAIRTTHWPDGSPIQVFVLEDSSPQHISFCKRILGIFPYQLRRIWDRQVFSGTGLAPTRLRSNQEMLDAIAHNKGAIGYINPSKVTPSVKILAAPYE